MIVDTSALVAILLGEPDGPELARLLVTADAARMSAATLVEARVVVHSRLGSAGRRRLDAVLREARVEIVPLDEDQAGLASEAYRDYGKGTGSPAVLNLGDCYTYALAAATGEPVLFMGEDFRHTDIRSAHR